MQDNIIRYSGAKVARMTARLLIGGTSQPGGTSLNRVLLLVGRALTEFSSQFNALVDIGLTSRLRTMRKKRAWFRTTMHC
jgi:hypothetical protein